MSSRTGLYIFLFFAALYGIFSIGHYGGDGYQDYLTAESIVLDRNVALYDRPQDKDELDYVKDLGAKGKDGKVYSSRGVLGMPLVLAPFYLAGHVISLFMKGVPHDYVTILAVSFANPVICALICMMVFFIAEKLEFDVRTSAALGLITGLCTMIPVYARTGFAGPAVTLFMLLALHAMLGYRSLFGIRYILLSAFFLALMVFCKTSAVIFVPCFLLYLAWLLATSSLSARVKAGHLLLFCAALGALLALVPLCNMMLFGSFLSFGGTDAAAMGARIIGASHVLKGLYYYLFSSGKSFFIYNIPVVLAFFALDRAFMKKKKVTALFLLIIAVNLLFYVKSFRRGSLFCWGPRYLLPSVPLLIILSGYYLEKFKGPASRVMVWAFSAAGFFIMLPCMLVNQSRFYNFVVEKLRLQEYMINFIPDLSPVKGAWWMLASRVGEMTGTSSLQFVYDPDYKLVEPISALLEQYNFIDLWFLKVIERSPSLTVPVYAALACLALLSAVSIFNICRLAASDKPYGG